VSDGWNFFFWMLCLRVGLTRSNSRHPGASAGPRRYGGSSRTRSGLRQRSTRYCGRRGAAALLRGDRGRQRASISTGANLARGRAWRGSGTAGREGARVRQLGQRGKPRAPSRASGSRRESSVGHRRPQAESARLPRSALRVLAAGARRSPNRDGRHTRAPRRVFLRPTARSPTSSATRADLGTALRSSDIAQATIVAAVYDWFDAHHRHTTMLCCGCVSGGTRGRGQDPARAAGWGVGRTVSLLMAPRDRDYLRRAPTFNWPADIITPRRRPSEMCVEETRHPRCGCSASRSWIGARVRQRATLIPSSSARSCRDRRCAARGRLGGPFGA